MKRNIWAPLASLPLGISASLLLIHAAVAAQRSPATETVKPLGAVKIILVGDSTTAVHSGWGGSFCALHVTSLVACVNMARGGRSSRSYQEEGSWKPPSTEVAAAAASGTTIAAQTGVAPSTPTSAADTVTQRSDQTAGAPMGEVNRAFDYTHLGREGADYFATMVTDELAAKVPLLSQYLVP